MYCRNCGYQMDPLAVVCVKCGVPAGAGQSYCANCGEPTDPQAVFCIKCGSSLNSSAGYYGARAGEPKGKSRLIAGILGVLVGWLGIHNFYLGYTGKGLAQLLISVCTCFLLSPVSAIWGIVEGIQLLVGDDCVDAQGRPLSN